MVIGDVYEVLDISFGYVRHPIGRIAGRGKCGRGLGTSCIKKKQSGVFQQQSDIWGLSLCVQHVSVPVSLV